MEVVAHQCKGENVDVDFLRDDADEIDGHLPFFVILKDKPLLQRFGM